MTDATESLSAPDCPAIDRPATDARGDSPRVSASRGVSRRAFLGAVAVTPLAAAATPQQTTRPQFSEAGGSDAADGTPPDVGEPPAVRTSDKSGSDPIVGEGDLQFRIDHDRFQLPGEYTWQITHNVATDAEGLVYIIHEGDAGKPDHPAIFVFEPDGTFVRAFGSHLQGGGHGLEIRREGGEEFLYVTAYQALKFWEKMTLTGERVWQKFAPMETGLYADGEATAPKKEWGRNRFMPTNTAFLSDGRFVLADGYGSHTLHVYATDGSHQAVIGSPGKADGQFNLPHGLWIDNRGGEELIVVSDRANNRLQWLRPDGTHVRTQDGFLLPANCDTFENLLLVPELRSRVTVLGEDNRPVSVIGDDATWRETVGADNNALRRDPSRWQDGRLVHPHDACFDADGNILLAEWVATGRVSKLTRV